MNQATANESGTSMSRLLNQLSRHFLCAICAGPAFAQGLHVAPADAPARITIADSTEPGTRLIVSGRVLGAGGQPVAGASIYAYHTDATGVYLPGMTGAGGSDRPRLFGYLRSDASGRYSFATIRPGSYPGTRNPSHIHFEVVAPNHDDRTYEIVFEGDPFLSPQFRAQAQDPFGGVAVVHARETVQGLEVTHDIRIRPR
jgi:protocatechuate 3,4-dioxygenase beta subunit